MARASNVAQRKLCEVRVSVGELMALAAHTAPTAVDRGRAAESGRPNHAHPSHNGASLTVAKVEQASSGTNTAHRFYLRITHTQRHLHVHECVHV